jgi:hypothetical protein
MREIYNLGESVVHRGSGKMGEVIDAAESTEDGNTESIKIKYEDGSTDWHSVNEVSKMLYEVEPPPNTTFLGEG